MTNLSKENFNLKHILIINSLPIGVMSFFIPIYCKALKMNALEISGLFSMISFMLIILRPFMGRLIYFNGLFAR